MPMVEASSQWVMIEKNFSIFKCVGPARMSHRSHQHNIGARIVDLSNTWGVELLSLERENSSNFDSKVPEARFSTTPLPWTKMT